MPRLALLSALVTCVTAGLGCRSDAILEEVVLTQPQLQERIARKFPVSVQRSVATLTLENPKVLLPEGSDRIGIELDASVKFPVLPALPGKAAVTGDLRYDAPSQSFFFRDLKLETLEVTGLEPRYADLIRKAVDALAPARLNDLPLYRLDHNFKERAAAVILKRAIVRDGALRLSLGL